VLTDGYLANGAEPWRLPELDELPEINVEYATEADAEGGFLPYERDPLTLARKWAKVGTKGLEHRIGGLEKQEGTGNVSYDPGNHEYMSKMRAEKVRRVLADVADIEVYGETDAFGVVSWGGTYGAVRSAVDAARATGLKVGHVHIRWINPFPANLEEVLRGFDQLLVAELNLGQLATVLRSTYLLELHSYAKIQGQPFKVSELLARIQTLTS
jgi:2-oxoglutarate ferredoxin oxidoreductase subunit alpha